MGCVFSRHADHHPTVYHVWNVDELGNQVNPGKLEVTRNDVVLHQKGKPVIRWPLRSLRRYGFDAELFSFESGRRCPTGPGIYAFKCRQAEALFNVLQEFINASGGGLGVTNNMNTSQVGSPISEDRLGSISSSHPNGLIASSNPLIDAVGYLEPVGNPIVPPPQPRSSISSTSTLAAGIVEQTNVNVSPGRVIALQSIPCICPACSVPGRTSMPHYINEEVFNLVPNRSNGLLSHQYVNSAVVLPDKNRIGCTETQLDGNGGVIYMNGTVAQRCNQPNCPVSTPSCYVDQNTNYARLDDLLKQEQQQNAKRFYVNVNPEQSSPVVSMVNLPSKNTRTTPTMSRSSTLTSPTGFVTVKSNTHMYASTAGVTLRRVTLPDNLEPEEEQEHDQMDDGPQVNYITLDLNHPQPPMEYGEECSPPMGAENRHSNLPSPPSSPFNSAEGYATIDFDKTAALSNSANPTMLDDSMRKTRHNSSIHMS